MVSNENWKCAPFREGGIVPKISHPFAGVIKWFKALSISSYMKSWKEEKSSSFSSLETSALSNDQTTSVFSSSPTIWTKQLIGVYVFFFFHEPLKAHLMK